MSKHCAVGVCGSPDHCAEICRCFSSPPRTNEQRQEAIDAARYRWLRENRDVLLLTGFFGNGCINRTISEVDAAIDAAMKTPNVQADRRSRHAKRPEPKARPRPWC